MTPRSSRGGVQRYQARAVSRMGRGYPVSSQRRRKSQIRKLDSVKHEESTHYVVDVPLEEAITLQLFLHILLALFFRLIRVVVNLHFSPNLPKNLDGLLPEMIAPQVENDLGLMIENVRKHRAQLDARYSHYPRQHSCLPRRAQSVSRGLAKPYPQPRLRSDWPQMGRLGYPPRQREWMKIDCARCTNK